MPEGGKVTPISAGIVQRVSQAVRYVISGAGSQTWFGPTQPLPPMAPPDVKGRRFDYATGFNLNYGPRSYEGVSFEDLRALADSCDILRSVIETRKDQMEALEWTIKIKPDDQNKRARATPEQQRRINAITAFFQKPDKENTWEQWLRIWLEDMFVIDAACFYKRLDRKGGLYSLDIIDGASIKILSDGEGRRPIAPEPAYQQILKGIPAADFSSDELVYLKHNPRSNKFYGFGHVEQVLLTVNILLRRTLHQLEYYREGSVPDAFLMTPPDWDVDQVKNFQGYLDGLLSGNSAQKRKLRVIPKVDIHETKAPTLKDEYDEFLCRIVCFVFSLPPTAFVKQTNRATADSAKEQAAEEGLAPVQNYVRNNLNHIIAVDFDSPDLVFDWLDNREMDPETASTIRVNEVKAGIISIDEAREEKGEDPMGGAYAVPMPLVATGYVAVLSPEDQQANQQAQQDATQALADAHAKAGHNGGPTLDDEHGVAQPQGDRDGSQADKSPAKSPSKVEKPNKQAEKNSGNALKKKSNPYLHMTAHRP